MRIWILTLAFILGGCAYASVSPEGNIKTAALGQASAEHCPDAVEGEPAPDCTKANGGPISDGFTSLLKDMITLPFRVIGGAAAAVTPAP